MKLIPEKYHIILIVSIALILFGSHLGILPINIMEARNFVTAREMLVDDNWLLTTMNEAPRYEKPPLPTWLTALSAMLFGLDNVSALRLPAVLITVLLLIATYKFSYKALKLDRHLSFIGTLILATSFFILFSGRNGQWDIFTHAFMMVGIHFFFQLFEKNEKAYRHAIIAGLFIGLSFMSKGPVSIFALFLPFTIAYGIVFKYKNLKTKLLPIIVLILIAVVLSVWWPLYIYFFDGQSAQRIANKETAAWANRNVRPFYYYWSFFTQSGIWTLPAFIGLLYPYLKTRVSNLKVYRFTLLWTLIAVVLLSVIPEKKSRYLLPVLIPLALNTSFYIEYIIRKFNVLQKKEKWPVYFNFGLIGLIAIALPFVLFIQYKSVFTTQPFWAISTSVFALTLGVLLFLFLIKNQLAKTFYATIGFVMALTLFAFPLSSIVKTNKGYKEVHEINTMTIAKNIKIYDLINLAPELLWDYGKPLPNVYVSEEFVKYPNESKFGLLVQPSSHAMLKKYFSKYNISRVTKFDHNLMNPEDRGYKDRLSRDFYILTKK